MPKNTRRMGFLEKYKNDDVVAWLFLVAHLVEDGSITLKETHAIDSSGTSLLFSHDARFVHLTPLNARRMLISGRSLVTEPLTPGHFAPQTPVLFPGGLAVTVPITDEGAELTAEAVTIWLYRRDQELARIRKAFHCESIAPRSSAT